MLVFGEFGRATGTADPAGEPGPRQEYSRRRCHDGFRFKDNENPEIKFKNREGGGCALGVTQAKVCSVAFREAVKSKIENSIIGGDNKICSISLIIIFY